MLKGSLNRLRTNNYTNMKKTISLILFAFFLQLNANSQDFKTDNRSQPEKEDGGGDFQSDIISNIDLLQALELAGLKVHRFNIGTFDHKYSIHFILKEYLNGEIVKTDTIMNTNNTYAYYEKDIRYNDYINQIKVLTQQEDEQLKVKISTFSVSWLSKIDYHVSDNNQNYYLRYYSNTSWIENKDIPLFVFASSWKDKKHGFYRFCGTTRLDDNDSETKALLKLSPHYYKLSYIVSN